MIWVNVFFKISLISNKAKRLGGVKKGYYHEKTPRLTGNIFFFFVSHLTRPEPEPTMVSWLSDLETALLTCCLQGRQNCNIYMESDRSLLMSGASYNLFFCVNRRVVHIRKFSQLERLCERTLRVYPGSLSFKWALTQACQYEHLLHGQRDLLPKRCSKHYSVLDRTFYWSWTIWFNDSQLTRTLISVKLMWSKIFICCFWCLLGKNIPD